MINNIPETRLNCRGLSNDGQISRRKINPLMTLVFTSRSFAVKIGMLVAIKECG